VTRRLAHEPFGWRPTTLLITIRRFRCAGCGHVWRQDTSRAAESRAKLSRRALRWALEAVVCQHLSMARVAEALAVSWDTANDAVLAEGRRALIGDPARFDAVAVIGVDEHCWRHTRRGDKYVTVIIDLTPVREQTGPARLLDMVEGRSKAVFKTWLEAQSAEFRDGIEVVAMDGFTGFKTAAAETVPDATAVMDPFHVAALAGDALDRCRQRVQQDTLGHRGRSGDPLYGIRRVLRTGVELLTDPPTRPPDRGLRRRQTRRGRSHLGHLPAHRGRLPHQRPRRRESTAGEGHRLDQPRRPQDLTELITLGRTLNRRAVDVLAYFDQPRTSNGPTEAINGRLEHLRGTALGFRNLTNYITRSLLETGGFRPRLHP